MPHPYDETDINNRPKEDNMCDPISPEEFADCLIPWVWALDDTVIAEFPDEIACKEALESSTFPMKVTIGGKTIMVEKNDISYYPEYAFED